MAVEPAEDKKIETAMRLERATYGLVLAFALFLAGVLAVCLHTPRKNSAPFESSVSQQIAQSAKKDAAESRQAESGETPESADGPEPDETPEHADGADPDGAAEEDGFLAEEDGDEPLFPVDEENGVSLEELAILEDERIENAADEEYVADASEEDAGSGARESDGSDEARDASVFPRSIVVPDDFETLAEALEFVAPSGVILLRKRDKPYELGQSRRLTDAGRRGALAAVPVTVRGETRRASDATVVLSGGARLWIDNPESNVPVVFEDVAFRAEPGRAFGLQFSACATVAAGAAEFYNCAFYGDRKTNIGAVAVESPFGSVKCVDCLFSEFGGAALYLSSDSGGSAVRCEFAKHNAYGIYVEPNGKLSVSRSTFTQNGQAIYAATGAAGVVHDCVFKGNHMNIVLEDGWEKSLFSCVGNKE